MAELGRTDEAKQAVAKILARYPDISIDKYSSRLDFIEHERQRNIDAMHKPGFPACAKPEELAMFESPVRLPECEAARAKAATSEKGDVTGGQG